MREPSSSFASLPLRTLAAGIASCVAVAAWVAVTASVAFVACASTQAPGAGAMSSSAPASDSGSAPAPPSSASATAAGSAPASGSAPTPAPAGPPPVGGVVVIGQINAPKSFDPRPTLVTLQPKLLDCYNQTRASRPDLRGKLTLHIVVNEGGQALSADADATGAAYDAGLVQCIEGVLKAAGPKFPKPGGTATVNAPLVFRP